MATRQRKGRSSTPTQPPPDPAPQEETETPEPATPDTRWWLVIVTERGAGWHGPWQEKPRGDCKTDNPDLLEYIGAVEEPVVTINMRESLSASLIQDAHYTQLQSYAHAGDGDEPVS